MTAALFLTSLLTAAPAPAAAASTATEAAAQVRIALWAPELSERHRRSLEAATAETLGALTGFEPVPSGGPPPPDCAQPACWKDIAGDAPFALWIVGGVPDLVFELRGVFFDAHTGAYVRRTVRGGSPDAPGDAVRTLLEALLPSWTRTGLATIAIDAPAGSVVKVDGRRVAVTPLAEPLVVPAGVHDVDVVFPYGQAVMWRRRLSEGARLKLEASPSSGLAGLSAAGPDGQAHPGQTWTRPAAYVLWSAGALAIAGSLVAGGMARRMEGELQGCGALDRSCLRIDEAQRVQQRGAAYAKAGNVLLVSGAVAGLAGAGLFTFDVLGGD